MCVFVEAASDADACVTLEKEGAPFCLRYGFIARHLEGLWSVSGFELMLFGAMCDLIALLRGQFATYCVSNARKCKHTVQLFTMDTKILAIVPAYNEQDNIISTVEDLRAHAPWVDYVVVDDGSRDDTARICRECGYGLISLPANLGLAGAFQTGMKYAHRNGYDYAIQFDADGQHSAAYIERMVDEARVAGSNIVIGSRFCSRKKPLSTRMLGSALITAMIRVTTGRKIQDPTSGMRLFDSAMIPLFAEESDFGPEPDTVSLLMRRGAKVSEVQVEMRDRIAGESYLNFTKSVSYMIRMSISILFIQWFRRKK